MVQLSHIYADDKTFVDQPLKFSPSQVLQNFSIFAKSHPGKTEIRQFVDANFYSAGKCSKILKKIASDITEKKLKKYDANQFIQKMLGQDLDQWTPSDWHKNPKFLSTIVDEKLRDWARKIHGTWKKLGRKTKEDCKLRPERYSIIYVPHPFIIPGGRYREFYYWDSYWIQRGLLRSEMYETVKGMILNFLGKVESLGYVQNGGRSYFRRSQPPFLILMMKSYFEATRDLDFLRSNIKILEKEFKFWLKNRMVSISIGGKKYRVARYASDRTGPRPESYSADYELAQPLDPSKSKTEFYSNIQSAAESGWDFSSRWFVPEKSKVKGNKSSTQTRQIVPVDLNSILFLNAKTMAEFYDTIGDAARKLQYTEIAREFQRAVQDLLWSDEIGSFFDFNLKSGELVKDFYASTFVPLWAGVDNSTSTVSRMLDYLSSLNIFDFPGGIPTSLHRTGEQWDFPNGWPPLNHIAIEALIQTGNEAAMKIGFDLANKWIRSNFKAFSDGIPHGRMFEKYDVTRFGSPGSGGGYSVVAGFGWTNGVILDLLAEHGRILRSTE